MEKQRSRGKVDLPNVQTFKYPGFVTYVVSVMTLRAEFQRVDSVEGNYLI